MYKFAENHPIVTMLIVWIVSKTAKDAVVDTIRSITGKYPPVPLRSVSVNNLGGADDTENDGDKPDIPNDGPANEVDELLS